MDTRISKLITYLKKILEELDKNYKSINADWLDLKINNYSLDKIPKILLVIENVVMCIRLEAKRHILVVK